MPGMLVTSLRTQHHFANTNQHHETLHFSQKKKEVKIGSESTPKQYRRMNDADWCNSHHVTVLATAQPTANSHPPSSLNT